MAVYFVQAGEGGPIKIGVAVDISARIAALQTAHWAPLRVLAEMPGGEDQETELHGRFANLSIRGEWFHPGADLMALIRSVASGETYRQLDAEPAASADIADLGARAAEAVAAAGSGVRLARHCGVSKSAVQFWLKKGIPPGKVGAVSGLTGIPLSGLRPDLFPPPLMPGAA